MQRNYTGQKKHISKRKWIVMPIVGLIVLIFTLIHILLIYSQQPCFIEDADNLVNSSMVKTLGNDYDDSYCLTRREVILIISDVFLGLKQKGFEKNETANETIAQALNIKMLKGDDVAYHLEEEASKQACLVFIGRGLGIFENTNMENQPILFAKAVFDNWAKPQIEGLVNQGYYNTNDIEKLYNLRESVSTLELKVLLEKVVGVKTQYINFFQFAVSWGKNNPILSLTIVVVPVLITVIIPAITSIAGFFLQLWDRKEQSDREKNEREHRYGTICLAGNTGVGKTTLKNKMTEPATPMYLAIKNVKPTATSDVQQVQIQNSLGGIIFDGTIIDVPGQSPQDVLKFLSSDYTNKILLLILAHTKSNEDKDIDANFIQEQLLDIQKFWTTVIRAHGSELNKMVIFINKSDLLFDKYVPVQKNIYKSHMELLCEAAEEASVHVSCVEGSSSTGEQLNRLFEQLRPI